MNKWKKYGLIIKPDENMWWMQTHAMIPTPQQVKGSLYKIYFSGRDKANRSHIGYVLIDLKNPSEIVEWCKKPVLFPGELGCFDDNGVTPSSIVITEDDEIFLYYIGWNPGSTTRMHIYGGLAISRDGGETFERYSKAPIIERCRVNPYINTAPFVMKDGPDWKMYYVSGIEWVHKDLPRYNIQYATSSDGKIWNREGVVAIDFKNESEVALARPFVIKEDGRYKMWFSGKGDNYRLYYAESSDGIKWKRMDASVGIDVSSCDFDSEMIEYAAIVMHEGRKYMFYNGNTYGYEGIGLAIEER